MPVYDHIHVVGQRRIHRRVGLLPDLTGIGEIAALPRVHGHPEEICPKRRRVGNGLLGRILGVPLDAVAAHAVQDDGLPCFIAELGTLHL